MNHTEDIINNLITSSYRLIEIAMGMQPYDVLAWTLLISVIVILKKWHEDPSSAFNIADLLCENGKLDSTKATRTGSWFVMSYGFYLLSKTSPETLIAYAPLYGGIWVSAKALDKWQQTNSVNVSATHADTTTTNITLTESQKDQMKQDTYEEHSK